MTKYSIQVCHSVFKYHDRPIPVTFLKFGWAKIRAEKLPFQDSMIKLCTKNYISRPVRRFVSTLSQLFAMSILEGYPSKEEGW